MKMISVQTTFTSKGRTFHVGETRAVEDEEAVKFCGAGWAKASDVPFKAPDLSDKTLKVHTSKHVHKEQKNG